MRDGGYDQRIRQANQAIRAFVRSLPDHRVTPEDRPEYDRLVADYLAAVRERDDADEEPLLAA